MTAKPTGEQFTLCVKNDDWVDHAGWHKGRRVWEFLEQHDWLSLHYIPKHHPELNFQEGLRRTMRYEETTNTYHETLEELVVVVFKRSQSWNPQKDTLVMSSF